MEKFIMAAGTAVRICDSGYGWNDGQKNMPKSKPVILLLHGYLESLDVWDEFTELLTHDLRVVAMDIPGHGISEVKGPVHTMEYLADVIKGVFDELKISRCIVAGHSMGGYVALGFMRKYPQMLDGIILFHSYSGIDSPEKKEYRQREIDVVLAGKKDMLAYSVGNGFAPENRKRFADKIADLADQVILTEDEGVVALLRGMMERPDSNDMLKESSIPQMFIFGRGDEYIPSAVAQEMTERNPQAQVIWLENSGHMGFFEEPQIAADAITDFALRVWSGE